MTLAYSLAVDIGHGRGRLAPEPAASIARIDAQLGRPADINEAWRSPEKADANYAAWVRYQNGTGPWAPYALPAKDSVHCLGYAADSDDWYNAAAAQVWRDNGWRQTARYPGTTRDEPWHGEYTRSNDKYYGRPASGNVRPFPTPHPEEPEMTLYIRNKSRGDFAVQPGIVKRIANSSVLNVLAKANPDAVKIVTVTDGDIVAVLGGIGGMTPADVDALPADALWVSGQLTSNPTLDYGSSRPTQEVVLKSIDAKVDAILEQGAT